MGLAISPILLLRQLTAEPTSSYMRLIHTMCVLGQKSSCKQFMHEVRKLTISDIGKTDTRKLTNSDVQNLHIRKLNNVGVYKLIGILLHSGQKSWCKPNKSITRHVDEEDKGVTKRDGNKGNPSKAVINHIDKDDKSKKMIAHSQNGNVVRKQKN